MLEVVLGAGRRQPGGMQEAAQGQSGGRQKQAETINLAAPASDETIIDFLKFYIVLELQKPEGHHWTGGVRGPGRGLLIPCFFANGI